MKRLFTLCLLAALGAVTVLVYFIYFWTYQGPNFLLTVNNGETFGRINYRLTKEGIVPSASLMYRYAKFMGVLNNLKAGNYLIEKGMTFKQIVDFLVIGKSQQTRVTIPEGKNIYEIAAILENAKICDKTEFIKMAKDKNILKQFNIEGESVEGYLYPDTYFFIEKADAKSVISSMVNLFNLRTSKIDFTKSSFSKKDIVILASVVEKETGASFERPKIAGVFINRLEKRMRLQSDPTVIYGIFEKFNGNLTRKMLQTPNPYNTYTNNGLPIGPIANPGISAIEAVISPNQDDDLLYFVSKNDGTHTFSKTLKEHNQSVELFQKNRKNREGKSWRDLNKNK